MSESTNHQSSAPAGSYSVGALYSSAWNTIKANLKPLALITLFGVAVSTIITVLSTMVIVNAIVDSVNDSEGVVAAIVGSAVTVGIAVLAGIFLSLLQIVALKKATEKKAIDAREIVNESLKYLPRMIKYGLFVVGIVLGAALVTGLIGGVVGPLALLLGLALIVAAIIATFRYAFVQFIIIEPKDVPFMQRFTMSQKMTEGIYGTIFLIWLVGACLGFAAGIVSGIASSPFKPKADTSNISFDFSSVEDEDDLYEAVDKVSNEVNDVDIDANYVISQLIAGITSGAVSLVVSGAFLELYKQRHHLAKA